MKKIMEVVLCLVLTFALVSCSKQEEKMKYDLIPMVMVPIFVYFIRLPISKRIRARYIFNLAPIGMYLLFSLTK